MPKVKRFYHVESDSDDEKFETEAFASLNESEEDKQLNQHSDSEVDLEISDGKEDSGEEGGVLEKDEDSDEDDAPEAVGFSASKAATLSEVRLATQQIHQQKQRNKERRQKQEEVLIQQKAQKLEALKQARLPEDFLEELDAPISKKKKKKNKPAPSETKNTSSQSDRSTEGQDKAQAAARLLGRGDKSETAEYIPLDSKGKKGKRKQDSDQPIKRGVVSLVKVDSVSRLATKSLAQAAVDFRQKRLNSPAIQRESAQARKSKVLKSRARFL